MMGTAAGRAVYEAFVKEQARPGWEPPVWADLDDARRAAWSSAARASGALLNDALLELATAAVSQLAHRYGQCPRAHGGADKECTCGVAQAQARLGELAAGILPPTCPECEGRGEWEEDRAYGPEHTTETVTCFVCDGAGHAEHSRVRERYASRAKESWRLLEAPRGASVEQRIVVERMLAAVLGEPHVEERSALERGRARLDLLAGRWRTMVRFDSGIPAEAVARGWEVGYGSTSMSDRDFALLAVFALVGAQWLDAGADVPALPTPATARLPGGER